MSGKNQRKTWHFLTDKDQQLSPRSLSRSG